MIFCFQCASLFKLVFGRLKKIGFLLPACDPFLDEIFCLISVAFTTLSRQYFLSNVLFENLKELNVLLGITQKVNLIIELLLIREMCNQTISFG